MIDILQNSRESEDSPYMVEFNLGLINTILCDNEGFIKFSLIYLIFVRPSGSGSLILSGSLIIP